MRRAEPRPLTAEINVTPLVDVVLVLLIIFMVVTPILQSTTVDLPITEQPPEQSDDGRRIVISIERNGAITIDGVPVSGDRFQQYMSEAAERRGDHDVVIEGDAHLRFAQIKNAMLAVKGAGFSGVGLVAQRREAS